MCAFCKVPHSDLYAFGQSGWKNYVPDRLSVALSAILISSMLLVWSVQQIEMWKTGLGKSVTHVGTLFTRAGISTCVHRELNLCRYLCTVDVKKIKICKDVKGRSGRFRWRTYCEYMCGEIEIALIDFPFYCQHFYFLYVFNVEIFMGRTLKGISWKFSPLPICRSWTTWRAMKNEEVEWPKPFTRVSD